MSRKFCYIFESIFLILIGCIFIVGEVMASCPDVNIYKFNESVQYKEGADFNYYTTFVDSINLNIGDSVCTMVVDKNGKVSAGIVYCPNDSSLPKTITGAIPHFYTCVDQKINNKAAAILKEEECKNTYNGVYGKYSYANQGLVDQKVSCVNYHDIQSWGAPGSSYICSDQDFYRFYRYMFNGIAVPVEKGECKDGQMCKIKPYSTWTTNNAECVDPVCEGGVQHNRVICRKIDSSNAYSKEIPSKCVINEFVDVGEQCPYGCVENGNNATCIQSEEITCKNNKGDRYVVGSQDCDGNKIVECKEDDTPPEGEFEGTGEICKGATPYCYTKSEGRINKAFCSEKDPYDFSQAEQATILNITTYSTQEFFCGDGDNSIKTAIGCIPFTVSELVGKLLPTIFGITGGIAFLMMVYGFILISTSSGDEKKMAAAKQIVTSAIIGLLVSVFALFLYKLIAVNILQIPGI